MTDAKWRDSRGRAPRKLPAIPPNDYEGTQAAWMTGLIERGHWDGKRPEFHGDVMLTQAQYNALLEECETYAAHAREDAHRRDWKCR